MKANEFLGLLFLARDVAHSVHWNTRSFSKHDALNISMIALLVLLTTLLKRIKAVMV